jgi:DNA mismatch endonuclease, patch repair protein
MNGSPIRLLVPALSIRRGGGPPRTEMAEAPVPLSSRSELMGRIRSKNTGPEKVVRSALHKLGYRFRLHIAQLPGVPDIALPKHRAVVLVHGCFWHQHEGCRRSARPKTNRAFWDAKLDRNIARDRENLQRLEALGWRVLVVWSCEVDGGDLPQRLQQFVSCSPPRGS